MKTQERLNMKNEYVLQIDSASETPTIGLVCDREMTGTMKIEGMKLTDTLLVNIDRFLKKHNLSKKDIGAIEVNPGPGLYTSLRVGVTTANILAFGLNIPVNNISDKSNIIKDEDSGPVMPKYDHMPNITRPKSRLK
jgi:tRNA threonylcarbamoyladenosine biosynthesis protein TsaB